MVHDDSTIDDLFDRGSWHVHYHVRSLWRRAFLPRRSQGFPGSKSFLGTCPRPGNIPSSGNSSWVGPWGVHRIPIRAYKEMHGTYIDAPIMSGADCMHGVRIWHTFQHTVHDDLTLIALSPMPLGSYIDKPPPSCELRHAAHAN